MSRRIITLLSALSLLLCIGGVLLCVRSYFVSDRFYHWNNFEDSGEYTFWTQDSLLIGRGGISWGRQILSGPRGIFQAHMERRLRERTVAPFHYTVKAIDAHMMGPEPVWGFKFHQLAEGLPGRPPPPGYHRFEIVLPLWCFVLLSAVLPCLWTWRCYAIRKRLANGLCLHCAYDLRASKDRCPECGSPVPVRQQADKPSPTSATQ